jgi:dipeptidyl aminopeptidase/acylaminoacyl peptidase
VHKETGKETVVTKEGTPSVSFGALVWAPDSKSLVASRITPGDNFLVHTIETSPKDQLRAKLNSRPYPLPGDRFTSYEMWVIDPVTLKSAKVDLEPVDHGGVPRLRWKKDARHATFVRVDRGHQRLRFVELDAHTGKTRNLIDEKSTTFINTNYSLYLQPLDKTDEVLYQSQRDGWQHLYLIDAVKGEVKNQITKGEWIVRGVDLVDEEKRQIWFRASGIYADQDPYLIHFCRINFDGTGLVKLTAANGNHTVQYSPDKQFLVATCSRVDLPPMHELRKVADGSLVCALEKADVSALEKLGWTVPEVFVAKGRDGKTDIWGIVCKPRQFDPAKKYPVIEYIYAGPHDSHVPKKFFPHLRMQALAELGFIVVQCDGMGTANRSKAFHDVCWKNLGDAGFPDRILWIKALAAKNPFMDLSRVGIYGTSAGGQNALGALLFFGDFYSVAVAACGCHDNRLDKPYWNEQWMGLLGPHYAAQSNVVNAHRLRGKLFLILGELDTNVPPESTMRVADALIRANKDFDLLVVPGMGHSDGGAYGERRRRDYFVRHLHGVEPPSVNR